MSKEPVVTINNGILRGKTDKDYQGKPYYSFQGIPYAKPPIGDLRFKVPQAADSWSGIKDATQEGSMCYSKHILTKNVMGSEDCLFLNVYTPELPPCNKTLLPVMFWIHGGGFTMGSGDSELYGPGYLINENVVLVTINYRLGLLGFLSFDDVSLGITGNAGLKDQVMALKWVNKNIETFGGDPNKVTIFGESAGGSSVHYLVLSPLAKGLFHNAILQSGTAITFWARGQRSALPIATALGMKTATEKEIYKVLKNMTVDEIMELQEKIPDTFEADFHRFIGPVVEDKNAESPFLTQDPIELIHSGQYHQVPMIIGFTSREGMPAEIESKRLHGEIKFVRNFEEVIPYDLKVASGSELSKYLSNKIKEFYYGLEEPSDKNVDQYYLLQGDTLFVHSMHNTVKKHNLTSIKPIYLYRMSVDSNLNFYKKFLKITNPGASHGDDIGYLFTSSTTTSLIPNSTEDISMKRFVKLWTTFAKTGNPNPINECSLINVVWKPVETDKFYYLEIGDHLTVGVNPEQERMKFWDDIYDSN